ncbi:MAG: tripartite tricarboxylate transporter TctB family protein [Proteobacteria bacterium]|nr:tripartite tricarboxylate transporter TctB family protein [Pseudomonadota bacterium]
MSDQPEHKVDGKDGTWLPSFLHRTDLWITGILLAISAFLYYETSTWETVAPVLSQNIPPTFFPRLVLGIIALFTLLLPFESYYAAKRGTDLDEDRSSKVEPITFITAAGLLFVVTLSEWLGTDLSMVLACVLLPVLWGERRLKFIIPFAIIFPLAVRIVFVEALNVHFLPGILEPILD